MVCGSKLFKACFTRFTHKMGFKCVIATHVLFLYVYYYLLRYRTDLSIDDPVIGFAQCCDVIVVFECLWALHTPNVHYYIYKLFRNVILYGRLRVFLYTASLVVFACCFVSVMDQVTVLSWKTVGQGVVKRLEDSIMHVKEDRTFTQKLVKHPATEDFSEPVHLHQLQRYPMEDIRLRCSSYELLWFAGRPLASDHVTWRLNGRPLEFTDRHKLVIKATELPYMAPKYNADITEFGIKTFHVEATLTVHLLQESDFGSYTCHIKDVKYGVKQYVEYRGRMKYHAQAQNRTTCNDTASSQSDGKHQTNHDRCRQNHHTPPKQKRKPSFCKCEQVPIVYYLPKDTVTWREEYRVILLPKRQEKLLVPPASILSFSTTYLTFSRNEETQVEYLIDDVHDFFTLCPDVFHGCSAMLLFYWLTGHDLGEMHGSPPFRVLFEWDWLSLSKLLQHVHCLCENSYGIHSVRYLRSYYNATSGQYELIEVIHPLTLAIIPRDQTMLNINFKNRSMCTSDISGKESTSEYLSYFKPIIENIEVRRKLALSLVQYFRQTELIVLGICIVFTIIMLSQTRKFLGWVGGVIRRCTLHGILAHYITAVSYRQQNPAENASYDVFLSFCDAERDVNIARDVVSPFLEEKGHKVCIPDRDLPAGAPEIPALEDAIVRSKRFIIFLSEDYLKDRFHRDFETGIMAEAVMDRAEEDGQTLVVLLDSSEIPLSLRRLPVYPWSTSLTEEDHLLQLLRWLEPERCARTLRSPLDAFITLLPLEITFASILMYWFS